MRTATMSCIETSSLRTSCCPTAKPSWPTSGSRGRSMRPEGGSSRGRGSASARHTRRAAFETLSNAQALRALSAEDVERLAESAWWIGRVDDSIAAHERAYAAYVDQGTPRRAAIVAVRLAEDFFNRQAKSIGNGWLKRTERLLQDVRDCLEHAVLLRLHAALASEREGNVDKALGF